MMTNINMHWNKMLYMAKIYQQEYYDCLPGWTMYDPRDHECLKKNIGFGIFGCNLFNDENASNDESASNNGDARNNENASNNGNASNNENPNTEEVTCDPDKMAIINSIYEKICAYGKGYGSAERICYALIYNITFNILKTSDDNVKEDELRFQFMPIFKIKVPKKVTTKTVGIKYFKFRDDFDTWYIDINGRIYKTWTDYKENNTLDECTMVLPKNGFYQHNTNYGVDDNQLIVWLEIAESPACKLTAKLRSHANVASTIGSVASLGIGIAAAVTPLGPAILAAGTIAGGASSIWGFGQAARQLIDQSTHEETINPIENRRAFSAWLGVAGSSLGLAQTGGTALISRAVNSGKAVGTTAQVAYNTLLISNLTVNGLGIGTQGYFMYMQYQEDQTVNLVDIALFVLHVSFFTNTVINTRFAGDLIRSNQADILEEYKANLRSKRQRKIFNRARRTAAENNSDLISENAEVIRYINNKTELKAQMNLDNALSNSTTRSNIKTSSGISLLDPKEIALQLVTSSGQTENGSSNIFSSMPTENRDEMLNKLKSVLVLLMKSTSKNIQNVDNLPGASALNKILEEMSNFPNAETILKNVFEVAKVIMNRNVSYLTIALVVLKFVWKYVKVNLSKYLKSLEDVPDPNWVQRLLLEITTAMTENEGLIINGLYYLISLFLNTELNT